MAIAKLEEESHIDVLVAMCMGTDKGRWWADADFGSTLWQLHEAGTITERTATQVRMAIEECLAWLIPEGLAKSIAVSAWVVGKTRIEWNVTVTRPSAAAETVQGVWDAHG